MTVLLQSDYNHMTHNYDSVILRDFNHMDSLLWHYQRIGCHQMTYDSDITIQTNQNDLQLWYCYTCDPQLLLLLSLRINIKTFHANPYLCMCFLKAVFGVHILLCPNTLPFCIFSRFFMSQGMRKPWQFSLFKRSTLFRTNYLIQLELDIICCWMHTFQFYPNIAFIRWFF